MTHGFVLICPTQVRLKLEASQRDYGEASTLAPQFPLSYNLQLTKRGKLEQRRLLKSNNNHYEFR